MRIKALQFITARGVSWRLPAVAVLAIMTGQHAMAADLTLPAPSASVFSWTGFYAGAHAGYGWARIVHVDATGGLGGGQLGYNYQMGNWVFGAEGDAAAAGITETIGHSIGPLTETDKYTVNGLTTVRGRVGWAAGNVLLYGTAGGAWAHASSTLTLLNSSVSGESWHSGWSAGGGIEWAFLPNWSAKLEYAYFGLARANYTLTGAGTLTVHSGNLDINTVKIGINYLFH
jgi:outer membrane immunogenic protein